MRSIFGWSYPPGCSGPPDEDEGPCECCGQAVDNCICPECPVCGTYGDPECYRPAGHGLAYSREQWEGVAELCESMAADIEDGNYQVIDYSDWDEGE